MRVKPSKCQLFRKEVTFLGYVGSGRGIATDPEKIWVVHDWPAPSNFEEVQSVHRFCSYYWSFFLGLTTMCQPITQLTVKGAKFKWMEECQEALTQLKEALCSMPVLAYLDLGATMLLDTDVGVGVVLCQMGVDGKEWALGYTSWALNSPEKNCCVNR